MEKTNIEIQCRLCAKKRNSLNMLKLTSETIYQVSYFCRIDLDVTNENLSLICFDCKYLLSNFVRFCEEAKKFQSILFGTEQTDVKVEIFEMPVIECFTTHEDIKCEPKETKRKLRSTTALSCEDEEKGEVFSENGSECNDENESSDSDSTYKSSYKQRKEDKDTKRKRYVKRSQSQKLKDNEAIELEVSEGHKNLDGTIIGLTKYDGDRWQDMRLNCMDCDKVVQGPLELKSHYVQDHSPGFGGYDNYECAFDECEGSEVVIDAFHKFLNHVTDLHKPFLKFCCLACSDIFWNLDALSTHYQKCHTELSVFNCVLCGRFFKTSFYLTSHETRFHKVQICREDGEILIPNQAIHTVETLFAEEISRDDIEHQNIFKLRDDEKNNDGSVSQKYRKRNENQTTWEKLQINCTECNVPFPAYQLSVHQVSVHQNSKARNFTCSSCPEQKIFFNLESFINHTFTIHYEHLRYFCFICDDIFWNYKALYYHLKNTHSNYKANLCLFCGKLHKSGYDLKVHKQLHSKLSKDDEDTVTFNCSVCPKTYKRKLQLQRHIETHKNDKHWICETCGVSFKSKSSLTNHAMVHQTEKPFKCDVCNESFKNKYKLKHHKGIHTGDRNYGCEICGQRFRAKGTLKGHILTHTGERPWKCEFCEKAFAAKYDLMVHTRLHTGEFTHECQICGERYPSWSNYSKHMRGKHQVDPRSEKKKKYDALHKTINKDSSASNSLDGIGSSSI